MKILTGLYKGRAIDFRPSPGLRPTADKVRKAIIDSFTGWISGKRVLDLYSGTGAIGMELLSAGAHSVVFVEQEGARARKIQDWLRSVSAPSGCDVYAMDVFRALAQIERKGNRFDMVVMDPPYDENRADEVFSAMTSFLSPEAFIVYECRYSHKKKECAGYEFIREKKYGGTRLLIYRFGSSDNRQIN